MARTQTQTRNHSNRPDGLAIGLLVVFLILASATAVVAFIVIRNLVITNTTFNMPGAPDTSLLASTPNASGTAYVEPLQPADSGMQSVPWDGKSRVNLLIMGLDFRDWEAGDTPRTDTMMLVTLDPVTMTAGMLSIPRDLWVNVPNFGYYKINTAYYLAEINHLPGGGPQLAAQTVSEVLGVPIDYYAQVDFYAFIQLIDEIGGVKVTPQYDIEVERLDNYPQTLKAGETIVLPGELALSYARNRYTQGGDFDRAQRQQEVIMAIQSRLLDPSNWGRILSRAPAIYQEVANGIRTNLTLDQVLQLATLAIQLNPDNIHRAAIGPNEVTNAKSPDGLDILIPIPDQIRLVRDSIFDTGGAASPVAAMTDTAGTVAGEAARVTILNGSGVAGLAEETQVFLQNQGINVVSIGNADGYYDGSALYIYGAKPYTANYLANLMGIQSSQIWNSYDPNQGSDITVILGASWANNNSMTP